MMVIVCMIIVNDKMEKLGRGKIVQKHDINTSERLPLKKMLSPTGTVHWAQCSFLGYDNHSIGEGIHSSTTY